MVLKFIYDAKRILFYYSTQLNSVPYRYYVTLVNCIVTKDQHGYLDLLPDV